MIIRIALLSALTVTGLVPASGSTAEMPDPAVSIQQSPKPVRPGKKLPVEYDPHTVLVKFRGSAGEVARTLRSRSALRLGTIPGTGYVEVRSSAPAPVLAASLRKDKTVREVTLNYLARKTATPNDPAYADGVQRYLGTIRLPYTWNVVRDATRQVIAVVDTGVDTSHPDLRGRTVTGYNVISPGQPPTDTDGHGTMVAGAAVAATNNRLGVAGVVWNGRVMPVKVFRGETASDADISRGIIFAYSYGAKIINLSLGGTTPFPSTLAAIRQARARGVLVIAASGNLGANVPVYPAAWPEVLAVGATDQQGQLTDFSSWGDWVDLTAPGWDVVTTGRGHGYFYASGTSFSAPLVAGTAALFRARYPHLTPDQVMAWLKGAARDAGPRGIDPYYGHGFLDTYQLVGGRWAPELPQLPLGEANDTPARATPLGSAVNGTFLMEGDIDWYRLNATSARSVRFTVTPPPFVATRAQNVDPVVLVYDADLNRLTGVDSGGLGEPETVSVDVAAGATYVLVYNYVGARDGRSYTLRVDDTSPTPPTPGGQLWINDASPADFATGVPLSVKPTVKFQPAVDATSVNTSTVRLLHGKTGAAVAGTVTYDATTRAATITPQGLQDNTPYRISVRGVRHASGTLTVEQWSTFRTVDTSPGPVAGFDAIGSAPGAVRLSWRLPGITDLDQVVVRRAAGTTPPSSPTAGTAVYAGTGSGTTATGLAFGTSYAFSAWVRDRAGRYSTAATTQIAGSRTSSAATPATVTYGQTATLTAQLNRADTGAAVAGHSIFLYARQHGTTAWRLVGRFTTNASGRATFSHKPSVGRDFVWNYYGSGDLVGSQSGIRAVHVRPVITSNVSKPSIPLGSSVLFYGSVSPKSAGQTIFLQRNIGHGRWVHVTTTRLTSNSTYMFGIRPTVRGTYWYRAVKPADADHLVTVSPTRTFRVT